MQPLPGAAVFLAGLAETGAGLESHRRQLVPLGRLHRRGPESLGLRTNHGVLAETFQFKTVAAVEKGVVAPFLFGKIYHFVQYRGYRIQRYAEFC